MDRWNQCNSWWTRQLGRGWLTNGPRAPVWVRRQQGEGGIMVWAAIINDELGGPFLVAHGLKMNSQIYCQFLEDTFFKQWYKKCLQHSIRPWSLCTTMLQNMQPSTSVLLTREVFIDARIMAWPSCSSDLNPVWELVGSFSSMRFTIQEQHKSLKKGWLYWPLNTLKGHMVCLFV